MYREQLENAAAQNILGEDYIDGHTYYLISDRDQFVVYDIDQNGKLFNEVKLEETPDESPKEESSEDLFGVSEDEHTTSNRNLKVALILYRIALAFLLFLVVAVVVYFIK